MKKKLRNIFIFIITGILFYSCGLFLQQQGVKNYTLKERIQNKEYNDYQSDFEYLTHLLEIGFPKIDTIFPKKDREKEKERIIKVLSGKNIGDKEFIIQARKYLSNFHNQHATIHLGINFKTIYPFLVFISNNKWFLLNIDRQQDSLLIGKEIIKINDIEIADIEKRLAQFTFAENRINKQKALQNMQIYNRPDFFKESNLISKLSEKIKIAFADNTTTYLAPVTGKNIDMYKVETYPNKITKFKGKIYDYSVYPKKDFGYLQFNSCHDKIDMLDGIKFYVKPWLQPIARFFLKLQFRKKKPSKRIAPYYNPEHPIFKDFVWELVDSLNKSNIQNLVIDLRNNSGGNLNLGIQLLYFLTDKEDLKGFTDFAYTSDIYKEYFSEDYRELQEEYASKIPDNTLVKRNKNNNLFSEIKNPKSKYFIPKNRPVFKGKVFVLSNHGTGSAAAMLTTLFQDNDIGTVIGTSVGNNPTGATTYTPMKLPKTKATVSIATTFQERPDKEKGKIQIPDYWVEYNIGDLLSGTDPYLEKAKELINNIKELTTKQ